MNVRELLEVLGAGDLDAEVWVGVPTPGGGLAWRPLECVEDRIEAGAGPGRLLLLGLARPEPSQSPVPGPESPAAEPPPDPKVGDRVRVLWGDDRFVSRWGQIGVVEKVVRVDARAGWAEVRFADGFLGSISLASLDPAKPLRDVAGLPSGHGTPAVPGAEGLKAMGGEP